MFYNESLWSMREVLHKLCFILPVIALLYYFRFKCLSDKQGNKGRETEEVFQNYFLLVTYIESLAIAFLTHPPYYFIYLSDLWLGLTIVINLERLKRATKKKQQKGTTYC